MTACKDGQGNHPGKRAVGATLAGVLAIGMVPAAAFAQDVSADERIETLFAEGTEYTNGDIAGLMITDGDGSKNTFTVDANGNIQLYYGTELPIQISAVTDDDNLGYVTTVQPAGSSQEIPVAENFRMRLYKTDKDGNHEGSALSGNKILHTGYYTLEVTGLAASDYADQTYKMTFEVKAAALPDGLIAWESEEDYGENGMKIGDDAFYYTGGELTVDHMTGKVKDSDGDYVDGYVSIQEGVDYTVTYTYSNTTVDSMQNAGTYSATITGLGVYEGSTATKSIKVNKFRLSSDDITVSPSLQGQNFPSTPTRVYDAATNTELDSSLVSLDVAITATDQTVWVLDGSLVYNENVKESDETGADAAKSVTTTKNVDGTASAEGVYLLDVDVNGTLISGNNVEWETFKNDGSTDGYVNTTDSENQVSASGAYAQQAIAYKVTKDLTFTYGKETLYDSYERIANADKPFDLDDLGAYYLNDSNKQVEVDDDVTYVVTRKQDIPDGGIAYGTDASGNTLYAKTAEECLENNVYGDYTILVSALDETGFVYGKSQTVSVKVYEAEVNADVALYVYERTGRLSEETQGDTGIAITSFTTLYDGNAVTVENFRVDGKDTEGEQINGWRDGDGVNGDAPGSNIEVVITDADGNELPEGATDAGSYKLVATSDKYKLTGTTEMPITIEKVDLTSLSIGAIQLWNGIAGQEYVPLYGKVGFDTDNDGDVDTYRNVADYITNNSADAIDDLELTVNGETLKGWDLPDNVDVIVQYTDADEPVDVGSIESFDSNGNVIYADGNYQVVATVAEDVAGNYILSSTGETEVPFEARYNGSFSDVQPEDWYFDYVEDANSLDYMNGFAGTSTFGPNITLSRGQACQVLMNMSGYTSDGNETDNNYKENYGWKTGFDDVDTNNGYSDMWYAQAVYWANEMGIVTGYGDGTFRPEQDVTREEFATMLARYASIVNKDDITTDGTALAAMTDASQVCSWAKDAVAWAVDEELMGALGSVMPHNSITRAEVSKMITLYQPAKKTEAWHL